MHRKETRKRKKHVNIIIPEAIKKKLKTDINLLTNEELVDVIRGKIGDIEKNKAFDLLFYRVKPKMASIVRQFHVPGLDEYDLMQEALYALRFKAIPDYNINKGNREIPYPFDKFAVLCIRRHISTVLKSSFQNKKKTLNTSISLNQDRQENGNEDIVCLMSVFATKEASVADSLGDLEYQKILFSKLFSRLSKLEKEVFILYSERYSYEEMADKINQRNRDLGKKRKVNIKSIDNAISRVKIKGKELYDKTFSFDK